MYLEGFVQELQHGSAATRLYHKVKHDALAQPSDAVPNVSIYSADGTVRITTTAMTWTGASSDTAWLNYDASTTDFTVGSTVVTGGTSGHTGTLTEIRTLTSTTGVLKLEDITGTFTDGEALAQGATDIALADGTAHTAIAYYDADLSTTATYPTGENYYALISYDMETIAQTKYEYFDVCLHPFSEVLVSSEYIDIKHPDWKRNHPEGSTGTWTAWCELAHVEIARRIRASGNRARAIVKREEMWPYVLAETEAQIVEALSFPDTTIARYRKAADGKWSSKGEFAYDDDDTAVIDDTEGKTLQPRVSR